MLSETFKIQLIHILAIYQDSAPCRLNESDYQIKHCRLTCTGTAYKGYRLTLFNRQVEM